MTASDTFFIIGTELIGMTCPVCGCVYGLSRALQEAALKDDKKSWYCTNGHNLSYSGNIKTRVERAELAAEAATKAIELLRKQKGAAEAAVRRHQAAQDEAARKKRASSAKAKAKRIKDASTTSTT